MKGLTIKNILASKGWKLSQVSDLLGESQQNFSAALSKDDIRTGLVERISEATGISLAELYGLTVREGSRVVGDGNVVNNGHDQTTADPELTAVIRSQQEQINRLLTIIETLSKK